MNEVLRKYAQVMVMDFNKLYLGRPDPESSENLPLDGYDGSTYLGGEPTLYVRTSWIRSDSYPAGLGPGYEHVGLLIPGVKVPDFGIRREALDWWDLTQKRTHAKPSELVMIKQVYPDIIKRVNLLSWVYGLIFIERKIWHECMKKAKKNHRYSTVRNKEFGELDLE
jgi:hypothetical protein